MSGGSPAFEGFRPEAIAFLAELAEHNAREWFQPRKAGYQRLIKRPMEDLCVALEPNSGRARSRCTRTRTARRFASTVMSDSRGTSVPTATRLALAWRMKTDDRNRLGVRELPRDNP